MQYQKTPLMLLFLTAFVFGLNSLALALPQSDKEKAEPLAGVKTDSVKLTWEPKSSYESLTLTVALPDGEIVRQEVRPGAALLFGVTDNQGVRRPDGQYRYELRVSPLLPPGVREALATARRNGTDQQTIRELRRQGMLPTGDLVQSGAFRILNGALLIGETTEPQKFTSGRTTPRQVAGRSVVTAPTDQVFTEDLIVQASACIGFDCVNNESSVLIRSG